MRDWLRIYKALINASWAKVMEYRAQTVLWLLGWIFPLVMMVVWLALVDEFGPAAGWNKSDFVSYYVGAAIIFQLTAAWVIWDWDEDIRTGNLSVKLLKPIDPFHYLFTDNLGEKIFVVVLGAPILAVLTLAVPVLHYPLNPERAVLFALSVVLGFLLDVMMATAFGMFAFWSTQARNFFQLLSGGGQFLSGWIAPLALFPAGYREVANFLPFYATLGLPVEILMGRTSAGDAEFALFIAAVWTAVFFILYRVLWRRGLRVYEAVGA